VLHPAAFFQNLLPAWPAIVEHGAIAEPYSKRARLSRVDYRDVAEVVAIAFLEDRLNYGTFELCADGYLNREEIAALIGEVLGRKVEAVEPSFEEWEAKAKLGYGPHQKTLLKRMFELYDAHGLKGNSLTLRTILGREPRAFRTFIEELARGSMKAAAAKK
jgi:uncharacterized protein YbjT (DUF2867 family)